MSDAAMPPAGWYPDPAGTPNERWWGGVDWTEHLRPVPAPAIAAWKPVEPEAYRPMGTWAASTPIDEYQPPGSPNTRGIWALAFSPAIVIITRSVAVWAPAGFYLPTLLVVTIALIAYLVIAVRADRSVLRARGLPTASPWWILLSTIAYFIARRIKLRAVGVKHHAPSNVFVLVLITSSLLFTAITTQVLAPQTDKLNVEMLETELSKQLNTGQTGTWTVVCDDVVASKVGAEVPCTATSDQARVMHIIATLGADGYFTAEEVPSP